MTVYSFMTIDGFIHDEEEGGLEALLHFFSSSVCNGEKRLISEQDIDTDFDINLEVHCTDLKQLEMQDKANNLRRSMGS